MAWIRLDDGMMDHPKMLAIGPLGVALHFAALIWCGRNLSDGVIPTQAVRRLLDFSAIRVPLENPDGYPDDLEASPQGIGPLMQSTSALLVAGCLLEAGLWEEIQGGFRIHDFLAYNPSRDDVLNYREKRHNAKVNGGLARSSAAARGPNGVFLPSSASSSASSSQPAAHPAASQHASSPSPSPLLPAGSSGSLRSPTEPRHDADAPDLFPGDRKPSKKAKDPGRAELKAEVEEVFRAYREIMDKPRYEATPGRVKKVISRLKTDEPARLILAIRACRASPFHMGENERNQAYNDLALNILSSEDKVAWWLDRLGRNGHGRT